MPQGTMSDPAWWYRHKYPVQSSNFRRCVSEPPQKKPTPVQVPASIRAGRDAERFNSHQRTIVICLDGTGDKFDSDNSNIVHLVSCLKKDDKSQVTYYQAGIGTYSVNGLSTGFAAGLDMAVGSLLGLHIRDAYNFLMHSYKEGDRICIFGFSRGAYTARCLAGMVHKVGLLPPRNVAQIPFAYEMYKDDSPTGWEQSLQFKKTFCIDVNIYFLGLFDSVASVGIIPRELPFSMTSRNRSHYFRHALALDERRAKFKVCRFQASDTKEAQVAGLSTASTAEIAKAAEEKQLRREACVLDRYHHQLHHHQYHKSERGNTGTCAEVHGEQQAALPPRKPFETDILEVWFLGCHADVGGGAVANEVRHKLSNVPLRWMIRQCFECDTGIIFNTKALAEIGLDVHMLWPQYTRLEVPILGPPPSLVERYEIGLPSIRRRSSRLRPVGKSGANHKGSGFYEVRLYDDDDEEGVEETGASTTVPLSPISKQMSPDWVPEQLEDYFDALAPVNDQLVLRQRWWILEFWPTEYDVLNLSSNTWESRFGMNLARSRPVKGNEPHMHWTVRHRMLNLGYKFKAMVEQDALWQVVA